MHRHDRGYPPLTHRKLLQRVQPFLLHWHILFAVRMLFHSVIWCALCQPSRAPVRDRAMFQVASRIFWVARVPCFLLSPSLVCRGVYRLLNHTPDLNSPQARAHYYVASHRPWTHLLLPAH